MKAASPDRDQGLAAFKTTARHGPARVVVLADLLLTIAGITSPSGSGSMAPIPAASWDLCGRRFPCSYCSADSLVPFHLYDSIWP